MAARPVTAEMRKLWDDLTKGKVNLAAGKECKLVPHTDYRLTKSDTDPFDLTDGKLTRMKDDRLWFDKGCIGWYFGAGHSFIKVDLGEVQPVGNLVIRLLGGSDTNFKFPRRIAVHVSKDGERFYTASSMQKLAPCESGQADWKRYYYIEEDVHWGKAWTYPFSLQVQADARYVICEIKAESGSIFSDEMVITKAEKTEKGYNDAYASVGKVIPMEGVLVNPRVPEIVVMHGLPAPQRLEKMDLRTEEEKKKDFGKVVIEFPKGVRMLNNTNYNEEKFNGGLKYTCDLKASKGRIPIFYLDADKDAKGDVTIYAVTAEGGEQFKSVVPLKVIEPPEIKGDFKRLHVSLSWMGEGSGRAWPDFLKNWRRLGFNVVSTFPRYWHSAKSIEDGKIYVDAAHNAGYTTIMNDSSFHEMVRNKKAGHEMFCQIPGNDKHRWLCPSYRGEFYEKEMERVARCVRNGKPDYVFYDIEIWHQAKMSSKKCTRCQARMKELGVTHDEFIYQCGKETMADLKAAIVRGAKEIGIKTPVIGSYNRNAASPYYGIERWEDLYPESVDMAQPSLYVCGRATDVHNSIRKNHEILGNKKIIPWLTAGTYGEFESYKMEQMVLEALLNGANGITYFEIGDFCDSPLDFYYHAKALSHIYPYEDLVMDGKVTEIKGSNVNLTYSMLQDGDELLLLVGNYVGAAPGTTVKLPFKPSRVLDLREDKKVKCKGTDFKFDVPKDEIRLFYIKK